MSVQVNYNFDPTTPASIKSTILSLDSLSYLHTGVNHEVQAIEVKVAHLTLQFMLHTVKYVESDFLHLFLKQKVLHCYRNCNLLIYIEKHFFLHF